MEFMPKFPRPEAIVAKPKLPPPFQDLQTTLPSDHVFLVPEKYILDTDSLNLWLDSVAFERLLEFIQKLNA
jgi:hypothetical protein